MKSKPTFILLLLVSGNISKDRQECHPPQVGRSQSWDVLVAAPASELRERRDTAVRLVTVGEEYRADSRVLIQIGSCVTEKHAEKRNEPCSLSPWKTTPSWVATLWAGRSGGVE